MGETMLQKLACVALLALSASASVVVHEPDPLCCGWERSALLNDASSTEIPITFYLKETNSEKIKAEALAVSDPASPRYGQHLTSEEVYAITAPAQSSVDAVSSWLASANVHHTVVQGRRVHASMSLGAASTLFNTQFSQLSHATRNVSVTRAEAYELPTEVDSAVDAVFGL